jgi:Concanavalin A-like lectin/glucanases superfamily/Domain of unknown function (DUF2341)
VRSGNLVSGFYSLNGIDWVQIGTDQTITLGTTAYVGLAVSNEYNCAPTVTFDNVALSATPDFYLVPTLFTQTASNIGGSAIYNVGIGVLNGFDGTITPSVSSLPSGVTVTVSPTAVTPGQAVTITLQVANGTSIGSYPITINATSGALTHSALVQLQVSPNSATFVRTDASTHGSWKGVYGADGYNVIDDTSAYPAYVTVTPSGQSDYVWSSSTTDIRALQKAASTTDHIAAVWYGGTYAVDMNFTDAAAHQIALYCLDWDGGRAETIDILDATSNVVLDTRTVTSFENGQYLVWTLSGHVTIRFTNNGPYNAVMSGLFFGPPSTAAQLKFTAPPVGSSAGSPLPPVVVAVQDINGNPVTGSNASITLTSSPSGISTSASVVNGSATFSNLVLSAGSYTLTASTGGLTSINSNSFLMYTGGGSFQYSRALTINHALVPNSDQSNFPVLFSGTYPSLASASNGGHVQNANGYDIIFTSDSAGSNRLNFEVESYDPVTGQIAAWVQVPNVSHTQDTVMYLAYGNSSITTSQANTAGVWDSNYQMVLHLGQAATPYLDSTINSYSSTGGVQPTQSAGKIGFGQTFDGVSQYIAYSQGQSPNPTGNITVETWIKTTAAQNEGIFGKWASDGGGDGDQSYEVFLQANGGPSAVFNAKNSSDVIVNSAHLINDGNWHLLSVTAAALGTINLYVDGAFVYGAANTNMLLATTADRLLVGATTLAAGNYYLGGSLDEVRISNAVRSADWIAAEYNSQSNPSSFVSVGAETP